MYHNSKNTGSIAFECGVAANIGLCQQFPYVLADYASEVNKVKKISKFVPSDKLVKHYALQNEGKKYFVSGFLTIVPGEFNSDEAVKAGLNLKKMTGDTYTYRCELQNLPEVIGLKGVKYIEVAQKVNQRLY